MSEERDWNSEVIAEFRANSGEVAAPYDDPPPMLLIHTIGARSGTEHVVPMRCQPDGESLYIFASAHGSVRNPDWYHNIVANPDITIEKGTEAIPVHATDVTGDERAEIFARQAARFPVFAAMSKSSTAPSPSSGSTAAKADGRYYECRLVAKHEYRPYEKRMLWMAWSAWTTCRPQ